MTHSRPFWISLEGLPGSGKSHTLAKVRQKISDPNVGFIEEPIDEWKEMLTFFYENKKQNGLAFQVSF